ncbi:hypothetical protein [Deinococcus ruber]|uniref:Secreted protein n=1 Tax=Deinococcus ruber TaxID=1848197 RepID=A0A918F3Y9_9DEIO|nr:hypothetical protein [Deinococcus ruber]GGR06394.1 hypothetical protein GCM10008957_18990 [Deinococcus ruber]
MKNLLLLSALAVSSVAAAKSDPCKLLSPNEVAAALGTSTVTASTATNQDFPSCNFDFEGGALQVSIITPAQKFLQGKTLLAFTQSGGDDNGGFKGLKTIAGLGDEAVGNSSKASTTVGKNTVTADIGTVLVRRGNSIILLLALANEPAANSINDRSMQSLTRRALLRLH